METESDRLSRQRLMRLRTELSFLLSEQAPGKTEAIESIRAEIRKLEEQRHE